MDNARAFAIVTLTNASATMTAGLIGLATWVARIVVAATVASSLVLIQTPIAAFLHFEPLKADDWLLAATA